MLRLGIWNFFCSQFVILTEEGLHKKFRVVILQSLSGSVCDPSSHQDDKFVEKLEFGIFYIGI